MLAAAPSAPSVYKLTRVCKKIFFFFLKKNLYWLSEKTITFIFKYFPKIPSEMNSKHPFYSILIPMTSHAKIFILVVGGPRNKGSDHKFWGMGCFKIFWVNDKKANDLRQTYILSLVVLSAALQKKILIHLFSVNFNLFKAKCQ